MVTNARIADLIREARPDEISDAIDEGDFFDMQTFAEALIKLVLSGEIEREVAANASSNRHDFLVALERAEKQQGADEAAARRAAEEAAQQEAAAGQMLPGLRVVAER
jgi:Tfp pilus assembly ATPase PilU